MLLHLVGLSLQVRERLVLEIQQPTVVVEILGSEFVLRVALQKGVGRGQRLLQPVSLRGEGDSGRGAARGVHPRHPRPPRAWPTLKCA